jgi:elongation factor 1-beta
MMRRRMMSPRATDMLARLKKEAEEHYLKRRRAKQHTLVVIEIKPWDVEQDLISIV